ncbi:MAG: hypothetical protein ABSC64_02795 [Candidatus Korobacteraceae bacterium]|jgi:hypothetical protein
MAIHRIEFSSAKGWQSAVMTASAMECATEARAIGDAFVCTKMEPLAYAERRNFFDDTRRYRYNTATS